MADKTWGAKILNEMNVNVDLNWKDLHEVDVSMTKKKTKSLKNYRQTASQASSSGLVNKVTFECNVKLTHSWQYGDLHTRVCANTNEIRYGIGLINCCLFANINGAI